MPTLLFYHDRISGKWARTDGNSFLLNRGFAYGDGIFDTIALFNHTIIWLEFHLAKLKEASLAISLPFDHAAVQDMLLQCAANQKDGKIRIYAFRGGALGDIDEDASTELFCYLEDFTFEPWPTPGRAQIAKEPVHERSVVFRHKTLNRMPFLLADNERLGTEFTNSLMINSSGRIACFTNSVVLWTEEGKCFYVPPSEGCIYGVGLRACLEYAEKEGFPFEPKPLEVYQLAKVEGLVAVNSFWSKPMLQVNETPIPISPNLQMLLEAVYKPFKLPPGA